MCGRVVAISSVDQLVEWLGVEEVVTPELPPSWNLGPGREAYVVASSREGSRRLGTMRWGLVPSWSAGPSVGARPINARAESLRERPAFAEAVVRRRCLVPVDGFYEWGPGPIGDRQPWFIAAATGEPLVLAGLWDRWVPPDGDPLVTFAIVTTPANVEVARLHDRMPAVLAGAEDQERWLARESTDADRFPALLRPLEPGRLRMRPVSTRVNNVANDGPDLLDEVDEPARLF